MDTKTPPKTKMSEKPGTCKDAKGMKKGGTHKMPDGKMMKDSAKMPFMTRKPK